MWQVEGVETFVPLSPGRAVLHAPAQAPAACAATGTLAILQQTVERPASPAQAPPPPPGGVPPRGAAAAGPVDWIPRGRSPVTKVRGVFTSRGALAVKQAQERARRALEATARLEEQVLVWIGAGAEGGASGGGGGEVEVARATEGKSLSFWAAPALSDGRQRVAVLVTGPKTGGGAQTLTLAVGVLDAARGAWAAEAAEITLFGSARSAEWDAKGTRRPPCPRPRPPALPGRLTRRGAAGCCLCGRRHRRHAPKWPPCRAGCVLRGGGSCTSPTPRPFRWGSWTARVARGAPRSCRQAPPAPPEAP
jgi:hypothetical protein